MSLETDASITRYSSYNKAMVQCKLRSGTRARRTRLFLAPDVDRPGQDAKYAGYTGWSKKNEATLHFPKYLENY